MNCYQVKSVVITDFPEPVKLKVHRQGTEMRLKTDVTYKPAMC